MPSYCAVFGCKNNSKFPSRYVIKDHVKFLRFHSCNPKYFDVWTQRINREGFKVTKSTKVCSNHFPHAQPFPCNPHPSLYLRGYRNIMEAPKRPPSAPQPADEPILKKRKKGKKKAHSVGVQVRPEDFNGSVCHDHIYTYAPPPETISIDYVRHLEERIEQLRGQLQQVNKQVNDHQEKKHLYDNTKPKLTFTDIAHSDSLVKLYTGLPSYEVLQWLLGKLETGMQNLQCYQGSTVSGDWVLQLKNSRKTVTQRSQPVQDEILMVLMKLRLNCPDEDLAYRFGVSTNTVSEVMSTLIPILSEELRSFVQWPTRDEVLKYYPQFFQIYDGVVRSIVDCIEVRIQRSDVAESSLSLLYPLESNPSLKFVVGIAPCGSISFVSKPTGGSASDQRVLKMSNIVELFSEGDICMAERAFNIKDLLLKKGVRLEIPFMQRNLCKKELSIKEGNIREQGEASDHVQRAIGRLKEFRFMAGPVPKSMVDLLEAACVVCAALVNLQPSLVP